MFREIWYFSYTYVDQWCFVRTETNWLSSGSDILAPTRGLATTSVCYTLPLYCIAVPLDTFSHIVVSGAYLQYGGTRLFDSPSNATLTVGATNRRVFCVQAAPVPTSIEWYNPQGQLVSKNNRDEVNQVSGTSGGRIAYLTFRSYQQSQGGKYECRVAGPGNYTERLSVCIGEFHAWGDGCRLLSISVHVALPCQSR